MSAQPRALPTATPERASIAMLPFQEAESMARREFQNPPLMQSTGRNKFWYVRVYIKGLRGRKQYHRERLGVCAEVGRRKAERARADYLKWVNGQCYTKQSQMPLEEFGAIWLEKHVRKVGNLAATTRAKYEQHYAHHIAPAFGKTPLCQINTELIDDFLAEKAELGLSWATRTDLRNILSSLFTKAEDWGYWPATERKPTERASIGKKRAVREKRLFTDDQVKQLLGAASPHLALVIRLADLGLRISEALGLRWRAIDLEGGWLMVEERFYHGDLDDPKSDASRAAVALGNVAGYLAQFRPATATADSFVFDRGDGTGLPRWDSGLRKELVTLAKDLGIYWPGCGFHSLRRGVITGMQSGCGATAIEAQKVARHSKVSMTGEYTQIQRDRQQQLVAEWQKRLEETPKPGKGNVVEFRKRKGAA